MIEVGVLLVATAIVCIAIHQRFKIIEMRGELICATERVRRYRMAVDMLDKWCGHESKEARLIAAHIDAIGEGRGVNGGTPCADEVCDIDGTREQLRRLKTATEGEA